jgi:hypothetical protein
MSGVAKNNTRGFPAILLVLLVGVNIAIAYYVYSFSAGGIGTLFGELFGFWILISIILYFVFKLSYPAQFKPYSSEIKLIVIILLVVIKNYSDFRFMLNARSITPAVIAYTDEQFKNDIQKSPSNDVLKIVYDLRLKAQTAQAEIAKLVTETQPESLGGYKSLASMNDDGLKIFATNLAAAQKVTASANKALATIIERHRLELLSSMSVLGSSAVVDSFVHSALATYDKNEMKVSDALGKLFEATLEYYSRLDQLVQFLMANKHSVENHAAVFSTQKDADEFNRLFGRVDSYLVTFQAIMASLQEVDKQAQ